MWSVFRPVQYSWLCKNRVCCEAVCHLLSLLHPLSSLLIFPYFSHTACTQISMHGFSFLLIFPRWDRNRCFSSFVVVHLQDLLGSFEEMAAWLCFLGAGCGQFPWLAGAQQLLRPAQEHLGHPYSVLPTCTHPHHRIKVGRGQMTRVQGSVWDWERICALCKCGSYILLRITKAVDSRLHRLGWKVPYHKHIHTGTQNNHPADSFTQHL